MKKIVFPIVFAFVMLFAPEATAQKFPGMDKSPADIASYPSSYKIASMSELAPAGKVWRTGANEAAEITFYKDVTFGGKSVKAGTYSLFTIPGNKEWTIILNTNLNQWGAYTYDAAADVVRVKASTNTGSESLEAFSIAFKEENEGTLMVMGWDTTRVTTAIVF